MSRTDRIDSPAAELARLGLGADAEASLRTLGMCDDDQGPDERAWPVLRALGDSANPERGLATMVRLAETRPDDWLALVQGSPAAPARPADSAIARAATVAGASESLAELVAASPEAFSVLFGELERRDSDTVRRRALQVMDDADDPAHALAILQRRALLRISTRDLMGLTSTAEAAAELADLAQGILAAACERVTADVDDADLAIIGMGKLGGRELNYVSDVDIIFVGEGDLRAATRAAEAVLTLVGGSTPAGRVYELDVNLRPEGRNGPLVRSLDSYRAYYERWAKTWEFQALLKARLVAGDLSLGVAFTDMVAGFTYPDRMDGEAIGEIQAMKGRVETSKPVRQDGSRQLKLAPGGLRDIEFAVQLLQLVHGRHDRALREPGTLPALAALAAGGYVDDGDANLFADAYSFLRTIEHRLQMVRLRRTHTIPDADADRTRLARACGFRDLPSAGALEQFDAELSRVRGGVRRLHEKLFFRPLLARYSEVTADDTATVTSAALGDTAAAERLAALGFTDTGRAMADLAALADGVTRRARLLRTVLPAVLPTLAAAPDPDGGLTALRGLAEHLGEAPSFQRALRDTPPVADLLARVLGARPQVGEWIARQPDVISRLVDDDDLARSIPPEEYRRMALGLVRRGSGATAGADALRRLKRREVARIAVRDLAGLASVAEVSAELTGLAEACLEAGIAWTVPESVSLAVIGLGKLGGRELGYGSDLDVQIVLEPAARREEAIEAISELVNLLSGVTPEGQAFRVDLGLRPEGKSGPLGRTAESVAAYYERWAETWELQALTQARVVAGDVELGERVLSALAPHVYPAEVPAQRLADIRRMKARVERERAGRPAGGGAGGVGTGALGRRPRALRPGMRPIGRTHTPAATGPAHPRGARDDLKLGPGGLSDVEWTVQLLCIALGGQEPRLRVPGARAGLAALSSAGILGDQDARFLLDGYDLLTRLRNAQGLGGSDPDRLPAGSTERDRLARVLGYRGAQALTEEVGRATRRIRKVHDRAFYDAPMRPGSDGSDHGR